MGFLPINPSNYGNLILFINYAKIRGFGSNKLKDISEGTYYSSSLVFGWVTMVTASSSFLSAHWPIGMATCVS